MRRTYKIIITCIFTLALFTGCRKDDSQPTLPDDGSPEEETFRLPKKELRGVWIATIWSLDWPRTIDHSKPLYNAAGQKESYRKMLDKLIEMGFNSVFVQIRSRGDAFYNSPYEPWSEFLTGTRGKDPGYDVLQFLIEETHARGLEFHAWINPYRIGARTSKDQPFAPLHPSIDPSWVVDHEKIQMYNPGVPGARQRLADIVKHIVTRYDIDGLHMDDYFYPDAAESTGLVSDQHLYEQYGEGYATIEDWRRSNVDKTIKVLYQTVVTNRPETVFSISPAPNKDVNYNRLFADVPKWCKEGWVDIVMPQLYQEIGNTYNDFQLNLAIWSQYSYSAKVVVGYGLYKFGNSAEISASSPFNSTAELEKQFTLAGKNRRVLGSVMYNASALYANRIGIADKLTELYSHKAIIPFAGRQIAQVTDTPTNLRVESDKLSWTPVSGDDVRYAVYYFEDDKKVGTLVDVIRDAEIAISKAGYYVVTSLNIDNLESEQTDPVQKN